MPSTYTLNNGIELIGTGEQSGTWGDTTNTNLSLIDTALDGQVTVTLASAGSSGSPNTLVISDGAASNGRNRMVIFDDGGDLGATAYVQLTPNDAEKIIYVRNNLSGSRSIILFQGTYNASNDYEVPAGTTAVVYFDGGGTGAVAANVFNNAHFDALNVVGNTTIGGNLTVNGNTTLGNAATDTVTVTADVASDLIPSVDGTYDLGASGSEWKDLYIDGTANIDSLVADTADINGGTIDGVTIGGASAAAGTFTTATATTGNITTVNATTVDTTNAEVTNIKAKDGTASATIADSTGVMTIASSVLTTTDINGGTIDGVTIASSVLTTTDINGGTIDGVTIATSDITVGAGKTLDVSAGTLTLANDQISGDAIDGGTIGSVTITSADINGGTIDGVTIGGNSAGAGTFTTLTATGNVTLGNAATDTVTVTADVASDLIPSADNTYDLGASGSEWKDLYVDGTANIDSLVADTADINGGTIDGVTIGTNSAVTEAQIDNINIDGNTIASTNTNGNIDLTPNGSGEVNITKVDIDSGTIDGTVIGGSTPAAISGTTGQFGTSLNVDGTITSDGLTVDGAVEFDSLSGTGAVSVTNILDEDNMASDSATALATQQSIKAYVDAQVGANNELSGVLANGNTTGGTNIVVSSGDQITTNTINETTAASGVTIDGVILKDNGITATGGGSLTGTWSNLGSVTTVDINGGTIDGTTIGGTSAAAGTFTTATATTGNITTVNATTVDTTNVKVTNLKAKDGTAAGSIADSTGVVTLASSVLTTADINGGTIDGVTIGGSSAGAISGTTGTFSGDLAVDTDTLFVDVSTDRVGIGTTSPTELLDIESGTGGRIAFTDTDTRRWSIGNDGSNYTFVDESAGSERMRINSAGNVGIGNTNPQEALDVTGSVAVTNTINIGDGVDGNVNADELVVSKDATNVGVSLLCADSTGFVRLYLGSQTDTTAAKIQHNENSDALVVQAKGDIYFQTGGTNTVATLNTSGDLDIDGALSKGSGSFKIDHPLKPETHHLVHSFIEGPQADNIYRGTVALVGGAATVNLDVAGRMTEGTFVALNGNVQCFTTNEQGWTAVRGSVSGNILTIEAQDATCTDTVSWLVIGERKDQHMIDTHWTDAAGRVITEPEKPSVEEDETV